MFLLRDKKFRLFCRTKIFNFQFSIPIMLPETLIEKVRQLAPAEYNSIIIDNAVTIKKHIYCYINAAVQRVEFRTQSISAAIDGELSNALEQIMASNGRYIKLDPRIVELMKDSPEYSTEGFFSSVKNKMSEMINGGREVDHHHITLDMEDGRIAKQQPSFAIKDECSVAKCANCNGSAYVERSDNKGVSEKVVCPACKGRGLAGVLKYFTPTVIDRQISIIRCLTGDIKGLKFDTESDGATISGTSYKIHLGERRRMLTHINGVDSEDFDGDILPYLDIVRDKVGEENAIEDYFYQMVPCYTFTYRNVLTSELHNGVLVDPDRQPALILNLEGTSTKLANSVKDSFKSIGNFFGSLSRSNAFKDKEDLRRTMRLLIAVAVADGTVEEEEKKTLTLAIRGMDQFTGSEQEELIKCLGAKDANFLTKEDFSFNRPENAKEAIARMQEMAEADSSIHETEREIIERLKLSI